MKYGDALPSWFKHVPFWVKGDFKNNPFRLVVIKKGDAVMDCGAHVGMFSAAALEQGAGRVFAYEPVPRNVERLRGNLKPYGDRAKVIEAVLVGKRTGKEQMRLSSFDGAHQLTSLTDKPGKLVAVRSRTFRKQLAKVNPDVVKVDVEGAEYGMFDSCKPGDFAGVRCLFIEFHPIEDRAARVKSVVGYVESEGFRVVSSRLRAFVVVK